MLSLCAYTIKGAEYICRKELARKVRDTSDLGVYTKRVVFRTSSSLTDLPSFSTIDDLHLLISHEDINRSKLDVVARIVSSLTFHRNELVSGINTVNDYRSSNQSQAAFKGEVVSQGDAVRSSFSITLVHTRLKRFQRERVFAEVQRIVTDSTGLKYQEEGRGYYDIKIFIGDCDLTISLKINERSNYIRAYKVESSPGSLRPSLAAILVESLNILKDSRSEEVSSLPLKVVDNSCGSGTILCEAMLCGLQVYGGDINSGFVEKALHNLAEVELSSHKVDDNSLPLVNRVVKLDFKSSPWDSAYFDLIVSNPPWGTILGEGCSHDDIALAVKEYIRIAKPTARYRILSTDLFWIDELKRQLGNSHKYYFVKLGHLGQTPSILAADPLTTSA